MRYAPIVTVLSVATAVHAEPSAKCSAVGRYVLHLTPKGGTCGDKRGDVPSTFEVTAKMKKAAQAAGAQPIVGSLDALAAKRSNDNDGPSYDIIGPGFPPTDPTAQGLPPSPVTDLMSVRADEHQGQCTVQIDVQINPARGSPSVYDRVKYTVTSDKAGVVRGVAVYSGQDADWDYPRCVDVFAVDGKKNEGAVDARHRRR
jgi:hypothetical protein